MPFAAERVTGLPCLPCLVSVCASGKLPSGGSQTEAREFADTLSQTTHKKIKDGSLSTRRTLRAILANTDSNRIQTGQFCTNAPGVSIGLQRRCEPAVINDLSRNAASGRNTSLINLCACRKKTRDYFAEAQLAHIHRLPVRYPPYAVLEWIKMPERRSKRDQRRIGDPPILGRRFLDSGDGLAPKTSVPSIPSVLSIPSVPCCSTIHQGRW